jgi:hypothetical protein
MRPLNLFLVRIITVVGGLLFDAFFGCLRNDANGSLGLGGSADDCGSVIGVDDDEVVDVGVDCVVIFVAIGRGGECGRGVLHTTQRRLPIGFSSVHALQINICGGWDAVDDDNGVAMIVDALCSDEVDERLLSLRS